LNNVKTLVIHELGVRWLLGGGGGERFAQVALSLGNNPGTHFREEWLDPMVGLDGCEERKSLILKLTEDVIS